MNARIAATVLAIAALTGLTWALVRPAPSPSATPVGLALTEALPDWVVALSRWAPASKGRAGSGREPELAAALAEARARVLAPADALGPEATAALAAVLDTTRALSLEGDLGAAPGRARVDAFRAALRDVNHALARAGHAWFLDGDLDPAPDEDRTLVALFVFSIEGERRLAPAGGGEPVRAVRLRRHDRIAWDQGVLGYTHPGMDVAAVLLEPVEAVAVTYVGPALAEGAAMPLFDLDDRDLDAAWQDEVQARAGEVARAAFDAALPGERDRLRALGALLQRRRARLVEWRVALRKDRIQLDLPTTFALPDSLYEAVMPLVADFEVRELRDVQRELEAAEPAALHRRVVEVLLASVEGHEVQHRLDHLRGGAFPVPEPVLRHTGLAVADDGTVPASLARVRDELSAYLSQVARDDGLEHLHVALLSRYLLNRSRSGTAEWYAALALLEGLAEELGLEARAVRRRRVRPPLAGELFLALTDTPPERVGAAARALWERWFAAPLPDLADAAPAPSPAR